ncbi:MAG: DUF305 domain-containing protein [Gemmatimonadetes bacterium]|nr:DUF305 domain-containing protein [Gemmatimonadota bacterium]
MSVSLRIAILAAGILASAPAPVAAQAPKRPASPASPKADRAAILRARADSAQLPYTTADIAFMQGMIHHHSQAIVMCRLAPTHEASEAVRTLCGRIINAQQDEIAVMQQWLRNRNQTVPSGPPPAGASKHQVAGMSHDMPGMKHDNATADTPMMPGMLTPAQMAALDAARGPDFDRLFLSGMIQHHNGAIGMVKDLLSHEGAAQDRSVFKFAADVNVDQTTEVERMRKMLAGLLFERGSR